MKSAYLPWEDEVLVLGEIESNFETNYKSGLKAMNQ
jgi:hypothetical protein